MEFFAWQCGQCPHQRCPLPPTSFSLRPVQSRQNEHSLASQHTVHFSSHMPLLMLFPQLQSPLPSSRPKFDLEFQGCFLHETFPKHPFKKLTRSSLSYHLPLETNYLGWFSTSCYSFQWDTHSLSSWSLESRITQGWGLRRCPWEKVEWEVGFPTASMSAEFIVQQ